MKYKTTRIYAGRYDVHITDDNGEWPQRIGCITGGYGGTRGVWLAESGHQALGYHKTKKAALQAIVDYRQVKTSGGQPVQISINKTQEQ
jgi:hypothetical protein